MKISASLLFLFAFSSTAYASLVVGTTPGTHLSLGKKVSSSSYSSPSSANASTPLVTNTTTGVSYQGTSAYGVEQFQNIFFGQSTAGEKRFAPPQPFAPPPNTTINATAPGAACPQPVVPVSGSSLFSNVTNTSEDCLSLRIARPVHTQANASLPVMIWIYGGGDTIGQIYDNIYNPTGLVLQAFASGQPIIYVAVNYRVNIFGFASSDALRDTGSLNAGLRDQRLGIQWVKDNIAAFGGDPDNITIFGESDGATGVGLQLTAYGGKYGVPFNRAIMQSGSPAADPGVSGNLSNSNFAIVADRANCTSGSAASNDTLACLRALPMQTLLEIGMAVADAEFPPDGSDAYIPVVDNDFVPAPPSALVKTGQFAKNVSVILGWNANDGSFFTSPNITTDADVANSLAQFPGLINTTIAHILELYAVEDFVSEVLQNDTVTAQYYRAARIFRDLTFTCPAIDFSFHVAKSFDQTKVSSRLYELNQTSFASSFAQAGTSFFGVSHFSDVPYVFNEVAFIFNAAAKDVQLAARMSSSWAAFAASGNPEGLKGSNGTLGSWPVAFAGDAVTGSSPTEMTVNVIGGPSAGSESVSLTSSKGPVGVEKLLARCAYLNTLYDQLQT